MHSQPPPTRSILAVPKRIFLTLFLCVLLQFFWHQQQSTPDGIAVALAEPATLIKLTQFNFGESLLTAHALMLYLQSHDNQAGVTIPFQTIDYQIVLQWLRLGLQLDPQSQYPLLLAAHVYAQVPNINKQRLMCDFVLDAFLESPNERWRWLAHCAIMAKHRMHDLALALHYAQQVNLHAKFAPHWATQMHIFILEDLGEVDSVKILIGGLLANGQITDTHELPFLSDRLNQLPNSQKNSHSHQSF